MSHRFRVPSSCAVTMSSSRLHHAATVAFEPVGLIVNCGSFDSARGRAARCVSVRSRVGQQCAREEEGRTVLEVVAVDGKDRDAAGEAHALLGDGEDALVVLAPRDALNGRRELPRVQALARLDVPQLHHVVRRARDEQGRGGCARERGGGARVSRGSSPRVLSVRPLARTTSSLLRGGRGTHCRRRRSRRCRCGRRRCRRARRCATATR